MIIGLSGIARSGKDTFSNYLCEALVNVGIKDFKCLAYADLLKIKLAEDFKLTHEQLYGDLKETPDYRYPKGDSRFWTPRELMQFIGTDVYRTIDKDYWVDKLFDYINSKGYINVIITDVRFPNELKYVDISILVDRLDRPIITNCSHESETSMANESFSYVVLNNSSLEDLKLQAVELVNNIYNLKGE